MGVAFDEHTVRPPAHTDGLWILLVEVSAPGKPCSAASSAAPAPCCSACSRSSPADGSATTCWHPRRGFRPGVHAVDLAFWCLVGFVAGVFLGVIACWISAGQGGSPAPPRRSRWP